MHFKRELLLFFGIKLFNRLPINIKNLPNEIKLFKFALKSFTLIHSFYSIREYYNNKNKQNLVLIINLGQHLLLFIYLFIYSYSCKILF
jgi:hypothetical protein